MLIEILVGIGVFLGLVFVWDVFIQKRHTILRIYPIVGHLRYFLESIGPELRQYWVAADKEELPFNRAERRWVYASGKGEDSTFGFGTDENIYGIGYPIIKHAAFPFPSHKAKSYGDDPTAVPCLKTMGQWHGRKRPYQPNSIINISGMSFGALGHKATSALNIGAREAGCFQNTGEGSVSPYHLHGSDLVWQIGTGYFGARDDEGRFSLQRLADRVAEVPEIKAIEIKLSQGAKPGKGGILPGRKVSREIAMTRGVPAFEDCISPNAHSEFDTVDELIDFIERIADKTGLPVGIKSAVGFMGFWDELALRMRDRKEGPDFVAIDGGEGGTGAAPLTFADHVSLPFKLGFQRVYMSFQAHDVAEHVVWIGSAKLGFPDRAIVALAMGCDLVSIAREAMFSIGCIQAQRCHSGDCPTGITTQSWWRQRGLNVGEKSKRCAQYIRGFRKELLALAHAAGYEHPAHFGGMDVEFSAGSNQFTSLEEVLGYRKS